MWIRREIESLIERECVRWPAIVLTGARQAGKTSVLQRVLTGHRYVSLEVPTIAEAAEEDGESFLGRHAPPVMIDEVQYAPRLLRYVKAAIDAQAPADNLFALTGSQKFQLMASVAESLAGRALILQCYSLSARELEAFFGQAMEGDTLLSAIVMGGYPKLHARGLPPGLFFESYIATYLERDVRQVLQIRSLLDFERFLRLLALRNGHLLSAQALGVEVGVTGNTIRAWLSILESSQVITLVPPYFRNLGKRLVKTPKVYFLDTGLACYLAGIRTVDELRTTPMLGALFETFVAGQIVRHFATQGMVARLHFYRDRDGKEVDFLIDVGDKLHLIECKWNVNANLLVAGFEEIRQRIGDDGILSRTVITSGRGYHVTKTGVARGDCVTFDYLSPSSG